MVISASLDLSDADGTPIRYPCDIQDQYIASLEYLDIDTIRTCLWTVSSTAFHELESTRETWQARWFRLGVNLPNSDLASDSGCATVTHSRVWV